MIYQFDNGTFKGEIDAEGRMVKGEFTTNNGDVFVGEWKDNVIYKGKAIYTSGNVYEGTFSNGQIGRAHV